MSLRQCEPDLLQFRIRCSHFIITSSTITPQVAAVWGGEMYCLTTSSV